MWLPTKLDISKINNAGQYISVDGRPLSSSRGIGHEIVKIFKPYVRAAASKSEKSSKSVSDPFLCLQIRCPRGTYDVNIEPAKDDLLFEDRDVVLALVDNLFRDHYGEIDGAETKSSNQGKDDACKSVEGPGGFELLMARKPAKELSTQPRDPENPFSEVIPHTPLSQKPLQSESASSPIVTSSSKGPESPDESAPARNKRSSFVNPWSISRINASFQTPRRGGNSLTETSPVDLSSGSLQGPTRRESESRAPQRSPSSDFTSPLASRLASGSPVRRRRQHPQESTEASPETNRISSARRAERERDRDRYGNGALDTWFQRTTQVSLEHPIEEGPTQEPDPPLSFLARQRFELPTNTSPSIGYVDGQNDGCSDSPSKNSITREAARHVPSLPEDQGEDIPESMDSGRGFPVLERWAARLHEGVSHEEPSDLEKALDFERRKKEAIQNSRLRFKQNDKLSSSQSASVSHSPHSSRYLAAKAALTSSQISIGEPVSATTLSPHDPRAYLIRQERDLSTNEPSTNDGKARRLPTKRLPFERIPDGSDLYNLGSTWSVDLSPNSNLFKRNIPETLYTGSDNETTAFSASDLETSLPFWNERLISLMKQKYKNKDESKPLSIDIDLASIISQHMQTAQNN